MFIRKTTTNKDSKTGKKYTSYRLVHTYRNSIGKVKQETLLNLGSNFSIREEDWKSLIDKIEQLLSGDASLFEYETTIEIAKEAKRIVKLIKSKQAISPVIVTNEFEVEDADYQTVDLNSLDNTDINFIGNEHVAYHAANQLELENILLEAGFNFKQSKIAIASIISRLIVPGSEAKAHAYLTQDSALDELMNIDFSTLDIRQLFKVSDLLLKNKEQIEDKLYAKEKELFNLQEVITLYDITNTYFEGNPNNSKTALGRSKEKRSDCQLVSLGLLLDSSGFPKRSKILPGNISEPSTLKDMLIELSNTSDTIVVMDAGIATKENIEYLSQNNFKYIVVKRESNLVMPEDGQIVVKDTNNNKVTVSLEKEEDIVNLYCHSSSKEAQCIEFNKKITQRFEQELDKLNNNLLACHIFKDLEEYTGQSCAIILTNKQVFVNQPNELISTIIILDNQQLPEEFILDNELTNLMKDSTIGLLINKAKTQIKFFNKLVSSLRELFKLRIVAYY